MTEHDELQPPDVSPTLVEAGRRRADLRQALVELEQAISRPAAGREADWSKEVIRRLQDLAGTIEEHVQVTERPGGLYDEITGRAPRLSGKMDLLRREHPDLREGTRELMERFEATPVGDEWTLADARDELQRLLGRIVRHRQLGADLVWEAYNVDIGGPE